MELTVFERILILNILPEKADVTSLRIVRDLQSSLGFNEAEVETLGMRQEEGGVFWNQAAETVRDFPIGPKGQSIIATELEKLSKGKQLSMQMLDLYDRFVAPEEGERNLKVVG